MEASILQQASQWRGAVGCRQGLHQFLGNPSHGLSPAGWMAWGGIGQLPVQTVGAVPCRAGCQYHSALPGEFVTKALSLCLWLDTCSHPRSHTSVCKERETWSRTQLLEKPSIPCFQPTALC